MKRRPTVLAATAVAAALVLIPRLEARADSISTASYRLTTNADIAAADQNAGGPQVIAKIVPPGTVVPPKLADGTDGSPLTILKTSTGFDQNQLIVALKDNVTNAGGSTPEQLFGLSFFGSGFSKAGQLDFSLNLGKSVTTPPTLESMTPGVSIAALQTAVPITTTTPSAPTKPVTPPSTVTSAQVPEPMSVILWSAIAGAGLLRARAFRRSATSVV